MEASIKVTHMITKGLQLLQQHFELEIIILNEINQKEKDKYYLISLTMEYKILQK